MKFSFSKIQTKSQGVSLVIALGISLFLSGMTIAILQSVEKSLEQSQNIERSNQVFFAAESGLEAAFFHHNARGQGVDFGPIEDITAPSQKIFQPEVGAEVSWTIENRKNPIVGVLHEGEKVSIPFFWDNSTNAAEDPNTTNSKQAFTLEFSRKRFNTNDTPSSEVLVPNLFDFGNSDGSNQPLIAWSLSRIHNINGIQSLIAISPEASDPCAVGTDFLCKDDVFNDNISSSGASLDGNVVPGLTSDTLSNFLSDLDSNNFRFSFQSLLPFTNEAGDTTLEGIPYKITFASEEMPSQSYTATAKVDVPDFSKTITVTSPEKQSIGAFDYLVFD